ncbi:MAG: di-trans,poly-cis-decaprenylcistransferase [Flavobacterium sp. BFFFF2]|nr:MAG: di-trans,poly-cis-decaprenylcistransferase [Flavobacterium sp. BFFFF2]
MGKNPVTVQNKKTEITLPTFDVLPKHIAIIMDGNGRWAKKQGFMRIFGHENGAKSVRIAVETCGNLGIRFLTLYAFSTENWNRPKKEVDTLMKLLIKSLKAELPSLEKNNIRLNAIGNLDSLPVKVREELELVIQKTAKNTQMTLTLALSYGSREELVKAVQAIADNVKNKLISPDQINESTINQHLYTRNLPDVDLMIRTSGEHRISNFLLWQLAYAELYFSEVLWPDFREEHLFEALDSYQKRERRFGKTSEQLKF